MVLLDAARAKDYFAARAVKLDITGNIKGIWVQPAWDSGIQPNPAPGRMGRIRLALSCPLLLSRADGIGGPLWPYLSLLRDVPRRLYSIWQG